MRENAQMIDDIPIQNTARDKAWEAFIKRKHVKEMFPQEFKFPLDRGYYELWCQCWSKAWNAGFADGYNAGTNEASHTDTRPSGST
jgi:hypothetical protein